MEYIINLDTDSFEVEEIKREIELMKSRERREDLEKYYKQVRICKLCYKTYGSDKIHYGDDICPICISKTRKA